MEKKIERRLRNKVKKAGGMALKLRDAMYAGFPDRTILMPNGKMYFVELKSPGKKPDPLQVLAMAKLRELGFTAVWFDNETELDNFLNSIL